MTCCETAEVVVYIMCDIYKTRTSDLWIRQWRRALKSVRISEDILETLSDAIDCRELGQTEVF